MKTICNYEIPLKTGSFELELPEGAEVLSAYINFNVAVLAAVIDDDEKAEKEKRAFVIFGLGADFDENKHYEYITTFQLRGGQVILHLFEVETGKEDAKDEQAQSGPETATK